MKYDIVSSYTRCVDKEIFDDLNQFAKTICADTNLSKCFYSKVSSSAIWHDIAKEMNLSERACVFISNLKRNHHAFLIQDILEKVAPKWALSLAVSVSTPVTISLETQDDISNALQQKIGRNIEIQYNTDPTMIGGLIVRWNSFLIDGSMKTRINAFRKALTQCL